jgi:isoquinoline 1-oxidoreductase beta subunit
VHALGAVLTYEHHLAAAQTDFTHGLGEALTAAGFDLLGGGAGQSVFALTEKVPCNFGVTAQLLTEVPLDMATGSYRSVYSGFVSTANEIMVDEIARATDADIDAIENVCRCGPITGAGRRSSRPPAGSARRQLAR